MKKIFTKDRLRHPYGYYFFRMSARTSWSDVVADQLLGLVLVQYTAILIWTFAAFNRLDILAEMLVVVHAKTSRSSIVLWGTVVMVFLLYETHFNKRKRHELSALFGTEDHIERRHGTVFIILLWLTSILALIGAVIVAIAR